MAEHICRAEFDGVKNVEFIENVSPQTTTDIQSVIKRDKKYGTLHPRYGKYFTFRIEDSGKIDYEFLRRAYLEGWRRWTNRINIKIREAKKDEVPDFRVIVRTVETDERKELKNGTIMYHYFPISNLQSEFRGLCVVNEKFRFTATGISIPHPTFPNSTVRTIDTDVVFAHENGHGMGLPHDPEADSIMSTPYSNIPEWLSERDIMRGIAKYGYKAQKLSRFLRIFRYIRHRSENY